MVVLVASTKILAFLLLKERETQKQSDTLRKRDIIFLILHHPILMLLSYNVLHHMTIFRAEIAYNVETSTRAVQFQSIHDSSLLFISPPSY
jgi:hypothetical protein